MNEGNNDDMGLAIDADTQAVYTTGFIRSLVNLDPNGTQGPSPWPPNPNWNFGSPDRGDANVFVQKLNVEGEMVWGAFFGGNQDDEGRGIVVDTAGNTHVTGFFQGNAHFDAHYANDSAVVTGSGKKDIFIMKLSSDGDLLWAKSIGAGDNDIGEAIALDAFGNVLVTGRFRGAVDFDPGTGIAMRTSNGEDDIFVVKLNTDGEFIWVQTFGGSGIDAGRSITLDSLDNAYVTGHFSETVDFGASTSFELTSTGASDIFVQKLDTQGNMVWAGRMGGPADDEGRTIRLSSENNLFVNGSFMQTADLDPSTSTNMHTSNGGRDIFVCRLDTSGQLQWAATAGGTDHDAAVGMDTDPDGNVLSIGYFQKEVDFDPGVGVDNYTSNGYKDIFWQKLSTDGVLLWAAQVGNLVDQYPKAVSINGVGLSLSTGGYHIAADFDPSAAGESYLGDYSNISIIADLFVQCMDPSGSYQWANTVWQACCGMSQDQIIEAAPDGHLLVAGNYRLRMDADPGPGELFIETGINPYNIFLQNFNEDGDLEWVRVFRTRSIHPDGARSFVQQLSTDGAGNIYLAGTFQDSLDADPGPGEFWLHATNSNSQLDDGYVVKLNASGEFLWAAHFIAQEANLPTITIRNMEVHETHGVYLHADAAGDTDVDPGVGETILSGTRYLLRLNAQGGFEWVSVLRDTTNSTGNIDLWQMQVLSDGSIRYWGTHSGEVDIDVSSGSYFLPEEHSFYNLVLNLNGQLQSAFSLPNSPGILSRSTMGTDGSLYMSGTVGFSDTVDVDPGLGTFQIIDNGIGGADGYLLKLDSLGGLMWVRVFPTEEDGRLVFGELELDDFGNLIVDAGVRGAIDIGPGMGNTFVEATPYVTGGIDGADPVVLLIDSQGELNWNFSFGNSSSSDAVTQIVLDESSIYGNGAFSVSSGPSVFGSLDVDHSADTLFIHTHNYGQYIIKWRRNDVVIDDVPEQIGHGNKGLWVFPNPATDHVTVQWPQANHARELRLLNSKGQLLENIPLSSGLRYKQLPLTYPPGLYLLQLHTDSQTYNAKLILR